MKVDESKRRRSPDEPARQLSRFWKDMYFVKKFGRVW